MIDKSLFKDKKAAYYTLGCKLNFSETSTIGRMLTEAGFRTVRNPASCSVRPMVDVSEKLSLHPSV